VITEIYANEGSYLMNGELLQIGTLNDYVIDASIYSQDILKIKEKVDVFFDISGIYSFRKCKHLLNSGGVYINTLPRPKILFHKILQIFTRGKKVKTLLMKHNGDDIHQIGQWISENKLRIELDEIFNLNNISAAHQYAETGHNKGKNVVIIK